MYIDPNKDKQEKEPESGRAKQIFWHQSKLHAIRHTKIIKRDFRNFTIEWMVKVIKTQIMT